MNIRLFLSSVPGGTEETIEVIERCMKDKQPFGLKCQRSSIIFIPHLFKAYWLWSDNETGPVFESTNITDYLNTVKMQYLTHKTLISTDELVGMAKLIQYEQQQKRLVNIRQGLLSHSGEPAGQMGASES